MKERPLFTAAEARSSPSLVPSFAALTSFCTCQDGAGMRHGPTLRAAPALKATIRSLGPTGSRWGSPSSAAVHACGYGCGGFGS